MATSRIVRRDPGQLEWHTRLAVKTLRRDQREAIAAAGENEDQSSLPASRRCEAKAQFNLGVMYDNGYGVSQDYVQAHMWYNLAEAQGRTAAARNRGRVAKLMTPAQIAEAQRRVGKWRPRE